MNTDHGFPLETPSLPHRPGRLPGLDGLRAMAFLAVFIHHAFGVPMAWAGVDLFFVLSGFLITGILLRQRGAPGYFKTFYTRRFLRIFPPYYLFLLMAFLILGMSFARESWWYLLYLSNIRDSLTTPFVAWLSPMWSLAVEEQYYLIWPMVVALVPRGRLLRLCVVLIVLAPLIRAGLTLASGSFRPVYHMLPARMDLLAAGGLLAILKVDHPVRFGRFSGLGFPVAAAAAAVFILLALGEPSFRTSANSMLFNTAGYSLVLLAAGGLLAGVLGSRTASWVRFLSWSPLVFLGTISYTMYLVHKLVLAGARSVFAGPWQSAASALALTVLWGWLSWILMEAPLMRIKEKYLSYPRMAGRTDTVFTEVSK